MAPPKKIRDNPTIYCECNCGGTLLKYNSKWEERRFLFNHHRRKEITQDKDYEYVYAPTHPYRNHRNKVYKHHLVVEEHYTKKWGYKFYIGPSLIVHHIDFNPKNNDFSNLRIMTRPDHIALHRKKDMEDWFCLFCHSSETYVEPKTGYVKWHNYNSGHICAWCNKSYIKTYKDKK
jgi:hypothetical protein